MAETAHQFCSNKSKKKAENAHKKIVSFKRNRSCRTFLILLKKLSFCLYYVYLLTHVMYTCYINLKVSGNPSGDHNLASIVFKKALLQLFLYFSVHIETGNYEWKLETMIYESQFRHFIKWVKICIIFSTFYEKLWASTPRGHKIFQLFLTSVC